ncbi:MAG: hypothetical protein WAM69_07210, partial [Candidatus Sulfotelmatobacter sp.]
AYNGALLIWLGYMLVKSPAREAASTLLRPQRWEQSLTDLQHPLPADSLIPMFEGMVDRALSRTQAPPQVTPESGGASPLSSEVPVGEMSVSGMVERMLSRR